MRKAYVMWLTAFVMIGGVAGAIQSGNPRAAQALGIALILSTAAAGIVVYGPDRTRR